MFSETEMQYIRSQRLARIATVSAQGQPDVAAVGFQFDGQQFIVGGFNNPGTLKFKNVQNGQVRVALVIDDMGTTSPGAPRGIKIHGVATIGERDGRPVIRITPKRSWSWGIAEPAFRDGKPTFHKATNATAS